MLFQLLKYLSQQPRVTQHKEKETNKKLGKCKCTQVSSDVGDFLIEPLVSNRQSGFEHQTFRLRDLIIYLDLQIGVVVYKFWF